jgi:predicted RNA-binding Zn-ribbon protein involved in translation (DUF1610 family)
MSNSYFCPHCGAKTIYESSIPAYCFSCGQGLRSASKPVSKASQSHDDDSDDDDEDYNPLNINKRELAKDWSIDMPQQKIGIGSFQDLAFNQSAPKPKLPPREAPKDVQNLNAKNILKTVRQECSKVKSSREIG